MNTVAIKRAFSVFKLKVKKASPTILTVAGVAGVVGGTYLACRATYKLKDKIEEGKEKISEIEDERDAILESEELRADEVEATENHYKKEIAIQTGKNVLTIAKLYAPAAAVQTASVAMLIGSHVTMNKRVSSLAAAYATLDTMYKKYRQNVKEQFGEDVDYDMRHGVKHTMHEEVLVDEDGKEHIKEEHVDIIDTDGVAGVSDYSRFFDSSCKAWDKNPEYNMMFLKSTQAYCNNLLIAQGYLFLNDVYKAIGFEPSIAGQSVGWIYDPSCPVGDNYIDFGLYRNESSVRRFVNGYENVILLDFNVDGDILHNPRLKMWAK